MQTYKKHNNLILSESELIYYYYKLHITYTSNYVVLYTMTFRYGIQTLALIYSPQCIVCPHVFVFMNCSQLKIKTEVVLHELVLQSEGGALELSGHGVVFRRRLTAFALLYKQEESWVSTAQLLQTFSLVIIVYLIDVNIYKQIANQCTVI